MHDLIYDDDLLIRYLDGELNIAEKAELEAHLQTNAGLQERLTKLKLAIQAVKHLGTTQQVGNIHKQMMQELKLQQKASAPFSKVVRYTMAIAASILVLFIGARIYMASQLTPEKLYKESFVDFNVAQTRSVNASLSEVEKLYQQKRYDAIIGESRSLHLDAKDSLLIGLSFLQADRTSQSIGLLERVAHSSGEFQPDGEFYLSLGYLKTKQYDKALLLMEKIAGDPAHLYQKQFDENFIQKVKELKD